MSDTPRTDARKFTVVVGRYQDGSNISEVVADYDTSCDLERENVKLKHQRDELLEALDYILGSSVTFLSNTAIEKAQAAIANAKRMPAVSDKQPGATIKDKDKEELKHLINRFIMAANDYHQASAAASNALFVYGPDDDYTNFQGDRRITALDRYVKAQEALEEAVNKFLKPSTPTTP